MDYTNKNMIDWSKPPYNSEIPEFISPTYKKLNIKNGVNLYHFYSNHHPLVSFKIVFHRGTSLDEVAGTSKIMFELLSAGTETKSSIEFATELDYLGANISFNESRDYAICSLDCLRDVFDSSFELLTDALLSPKFEEQEIEKTIRKFISAKEQEESDSNYLSTTAMMASLFREHPYGNPEYGYADEKDEYTRKQIRNAWESYINNCNISIIATGNIKEEKAINYAKLITNEMADDIEEVVLDEVTYRENNRLVIVDFSSSSQSVISVGKQTINIKDENYPALNLLNVIFGGYFMSRLNHLIREQKGLSYGVHSSISSAEYSGLLGITTSVNLDKSLEVVQDILNEMGKLSNEMIEADELQRAQNYYLGSFLRGIESHKQISKMLTTIALNNLDEYYYHDYYTKIKTLRGDDLFSTQIDYLKPEGLVIALAGIEERLVEQFAGEFEKYDILDKEGKIIKRYENNSVNNS